jgi:hypothetical protein
MPGFFRHQSVCRFKTPCKTPLIKFLIIFQPFCCMDQSIVLGLFYRKGIVIRIMNFPVDHHQFLIHFPGDSHFLNHVCCMRDIPYAGTYRLLAVSFPRSGLLRDIGLFQGTWRRDYTSSSHVCLFISNSFHFHDFVMKILKTSDDR